MSQAAGPSSTRARATAASPATRPARIASGGKRFTGRWSRTRITNAAVTSRVYARTNSVRASLAGRSSSARLGPPAASATPHPRAVRGCARSESAASGKPTGLGEAQAAKAIVPTIRRQGAPSRRGVMSAGVPLDVGNQRELACALDRGGELALVPRAHPRQPARQNLAALGQEAAQGAVVLVVEHADPGLAHGTRLG